MYGLTGSAVPTTGFVLVGATDAETPPPPPRLAEHAPASLAPAGKTAPVLHCPFSNTGVASYGSVEGGLRRTVKS